MKYKLQNLTSVFVGTCSTLEGRGPGEAEKEGADSKFVSFIELCIVVARGESRPEMSTGSFGESGIAGFRFSSSSAV